MAELKRFVDKDALLAEWDKQSSRGHYEFDQTIMEFPVTTDSEIRAEAIDEFAEKLNAKIEEVYSAPERESEYNHAWKTVCRIIQGNMEVIAEQLKKYGKDTNVPSRCDTCTHNVADEVPPICYMCSKGIEDNYQKGE